MKIPHLRWGLVGLMFAATALSFLDRQVLSVVAPTLAQEFGMSNLAYSWVTTAFMVSYAAMFFLGGRMMDRLGTRLGMALSVGVWSVASALHAIAQNAWQLGFYRFVLGAGEGGCFPGVTKGAAECFPQRQRALAIGIAIGGASLGGVAAPPLTVLLVGLAGWRGAFVATGLLGALWLTLWWLFYHPPAETPEITGNEPSSVERDPIGLDRPGSESPSLVDLLGRSDVWGLALMRFIFDPVFYFYMFWIPKYLSQERGLSLDEIGTLTWIPFLALGVSNILGGLASDHLIRRGLSAQRARLVVMALAALLTMSSSATAWAGSVHLAIAMMSLLMFAHGFWITNYVTIISERFPRNAVGTVMGFAGMIGALGGMGANTAIGWIADHFSFTPVWLASGGMYPLAFIVLLLAVRSKPGSSERRGVSPT